MFPNPKLEEVLFIIIVLAMPLFAAILIALRRYKTWKILLTLILCTWFSSLATLIVNRPENGLPIFAYFLMGWILAAPVIPFLLLFLCIRAISTHRFPRTVPYLKNAAGIALYVIILGCILGIGYGFLPPGEEHLKNLARSHAHDSRWEDVPGTNEGITITPCPTGWQATWLHSDAKTSSAIYMNLYGGYDYGEINPTWTYRHDSRP